MPIKKIAGKMNPKAIIQARVGSTRLPGKVLLKVKGKTILEYVVERVKQSKNLQDVIVATTTKEGDSQIADIANRLGATVYRGSEDDVLDRYYQAAKRFDAKHIVRITADCPLIDPEVIDKVIRAYYAFDVDYCCNGTTFPSGQNVEVFSFEALKWAWRDAKSALEREHVTPFLRKKSKKLIFCNREDFSKEKWSVDTKEDFQWVKTVIEALPADFRMRDILNFLKSNPQLNRKINYQRDLEDLRDGIHFRAESPYC